MNAILRNNWRSFRSVFFIIFKDTVLKNIIDVFDCNHVLKTEPDNLTQPIIRLICNS